MRAAMIALTIVLLTSSAWAGPAARRMMAVVGSGVTYEPFTINGMGSITSASGPTTTGTEIITTGDGFIRVFATCDATENFSEEPSHIVLTVDALFSELICQPGDAKTETLRVPVTSGTHNVTVSAVNPTPNAQFTAGNFRKPRPTQQIVTDNGEAVYDNGEQVTD